MILSCDELVALCRNRKTISYSCHALLLKPVQRCLPSLGKREAASQCDHCSSDSECVCQNEVGAMPVGTRAISAWWKTVHVHTMCECLCSYKNCLPMTINCRVYQQKCQELTSGKRRIIQKFILLWYRTTFLKLPFILKGLHILVQIAHLWIRHHTSYLCYMSAQCDESRSIPVLKYKRQTVLRAWYNLSYRIRTIYGIPTSAKLFQIKTTLGGLNSEVPLYVNVAKIYCTSCKCVSV